MVEARAVVGDLDLVPLDRAIQDKACELADPQLRTLDALHLASALPLGDELTALISYDCRARWRGTRCCLTVAAPGQSPPKPRN